MDYLKIFAPATVANVSCGFDSLGFAVDAIGDEMTFTKTVEKGVKITNITGAVLPYNVDENAARSTRCQRAVRVGFVRARGNFEKWCWHTREYRITQIPIHWADASWGPVDPQTIDFAVAWPNSNRSTTGCSHPGASRR